MEKPHGEQMPPSASMEKKAGLDFLREDTWLETLKKEFDPNFTLDVLMPKLWGPWSEKIFHPEDIERWEETEKRAYLEALGRLGGGLDYVSRSFYGIARFEDGLLPECRRLAGRLEEHREDGGRALMRVGAFFRARSINTNTSGRQSDAYNEMREKAIKRYSADGDREAVRSLLNPYHIEAGTEFVHIGNDPEKPELVVDTVQDFLIDDTAGMLVINDNLLDLDEANAGLARGRFMLKSGENYFGGLEYLRAQTIKHYSIGSVIEYKPFLDLEEGVRKYRVVGSNQAELEEKYGQAFLPFILRTAGLMKVDIELPDGSVSRNEDVTEIEKWRVRTA